MKQGTAAMEETQAAYHHRWIFLVGAFFQLTATSTAIFGWPSMAFILSEEGVFADACDGESLDEAG